MKQRLMHNLTAGMGMVAGFCFAIASGLPPKIAFLAAFILGVVILRGFRRKARLQRQLDDTPLRANTTHLRYTVPATPNACIQALSKKQKTDTMAYVFSWNDQKQTGVLLLKPQTRPGGSLYDVTYTVSFTQNQAGQTVLALHWADATASPRLSGAPFYWIDDFLAQKLSAARIEAAPTAKAPNTL
ncbi:MAG: hypothetical protein PHG02_00420 [Oscillospiraceae bacterium]|nr:hypothetical protein [Oscillospiraceae bacterium]